MGKQVIDINWDQKFDFAGTFKKPIMKVLVLGAILLVAGIVIEMMAGGHEEVAEAGDHAYHWYHRLFAAIWVNNIYFAGIAVIGVFFFALQYAAQAGWSAPILRIPLSFGNWLPYAAVITIVSYFIVGHDIFHWTHSYLYDVNDPQYDRIIDGKGGFFFWPMAKGSFPIFFIVRMVVFFAAWALFFNKLKQLSYAEDLEKSDSYWRRTRTVSAIFLVFFAVSSSVAAWDWIMSIDTHWFSTMFGWYMFASWFVAGLSAVTLITLFLKDKGYLEMVNSNHIHDLGKFMFAFSIFWTYIWFSQFLLIYYANIPEESVYFVERLQSELYGPLVFVNLGLNFILPFLVLMTRDAKRHGVFLKVVSVLIIVGHYIDYTLMVQPGTLREHGGLGLIEIGLFLAYGSVVAIVVLTGLSKGNLVPKNHPMLEESLQHHI